MPSIIKNIVYFRHNGVFFQQLFWKRLLSIPKRVLFNFRAQLKYPDIYRLVKPVDGLISFNLGIILYESVLNSSHSSNNIVEVGAFKGLSTIYLSIAAKKINKKIKTFELFTGLPSVDNKLDAGFRKHEFSSTIDEFKSNVAKYGCSESVDLIIGDARENLLPELKNNGFALAFIDVDVYDVTKDILMKLWKVARGNEIIVVHDSDYPGIRKAIEQFHNETNYVCKETFPENGTSKLILPSKINNNNK